MPERLKCGGKVEESLTKKKMVIGWSMTGKQKLEYIIFNACTRPFFKVYLKEKNLVFLL